MKITILLVAFLILIYLIKNKNIERFSLKDTYSQINQDLKVLDHYNKKRNGYFVEIGANDGISLSNTYLLEKKYNWKGICIEPVPSIFKKLKNNRKSINVKNAIYNVDNKIVNIVESNLLSGIRDDIDKHKHILKNKDVKVMTKTLTTILNENKSPRKIDYLSIDTEGSELKILKGIDFEKYKFGYINIEHNFIEPRRKQMKKLLQKNGYKYQGENKFDDIYVCKNY
jgi:FkbM family methyltransferase